MNTAAFPLSARRPEADHPLNQLIGPGASSLVRTLRAAAKLLVLGASLALLGIIAFGGQAKAGQIMAETGVFVGQTEAQYSMNVTSTGSLTVNLFDYAWPGPLADLTLEIASPTQILGQMSAAGTDTVMLTAPGTYYAYVTGNAANSPLGLGAYGLSANFKPSGQAAPVPLPASLSLLIGGIAVTVWSVRRKGRAVDHTDRERTPGLVGVPG